MKEKHTFTDIPENHWAKDAISTLQSNKAIVGTGNGLSRYLWAIKLPPQNLDGAKKLGGSPAARKRPIGES
ncbi:S-layer homology domain-containing protein [Bacillus mycoides]|uniref:S-layer homology domain-containing protein n=1 Tax=Bacillus mycoides TaxID=1405 RepID=A0AAP8KVZ6_BACMY|nr:S-layer homology domain-containing protein [Bacillus mycoides]EEM00539.1 hypothetical protein bmyco0001_9750 [Bacillus mycoides DSM 2048]AJH19640.1 hypothetical protein BG05_4768 [Bacillus mycoides]EJQ61210.1 hypothetical protein IEY_04392 [Bacillus mycoides]EJQ65029.1 hypothetical protein IEW_00941 [Bacillus mycoides]EJV71682.1 hypothetical protein IEU_00942 [Bacillus mycoides]